MPADILIYAIIAAGLVFWLRNILGTRHGDERERPNPFTSHSDSLGNKQTEPDMPGAAPGLIPGQEADLSAGLDRHMEIAGAAVEEDLHQIARSDRTFSLPFFMRGAQDAFVIVIEAFAAGDKDTLKDLLSPAVYSAFEGAIDRREKHGETAQIEIHSIRRTEVLAAQIRDKVAYITVRFTADETSIVRDKDGKVTTGDPERVTETIDIWTFGRPLKSASPAWLVYETREDEDDEVAGSTVPETDAE